MKEVNNNEKSEMDTIRQFYDEVYYKNKKAGTRVNRHLQALARRLSITSSMQVLDVACGAGEWLQTCAASGAVTCGVDLSEKAISLCRSVLPQGEFFAQPAETLPFADKRFDVVTCLGSLEHFVRPQQALQEMVRVAKPNAQFILLVPNADFLTRKLGLYGGTYQTDAKEEVRTLEAWQALFDSAGLQVVERWKDLHVLSWAWIRIGKWQQMPVRIIQALLLAVWPLRWQYQVYHRCQIKLPGKIVT